jgi:hypothetical protein
MDSVDKPVTAEVIHQAEKYAKMLARQRAYYHRNADKISAKWKEQHHQANPGAGVRPNRRRKGSSSDEGSS